MYLVRILLFCLIVFSFHVPVADAAAGGLLSGKKTTREGTIEFPGRITDGQTSYSANFMVGSKITYDLGNVYKITEIHSYADPVIVKLYNSDMEVIHQFQAWKAAGWRQVSYPKVRAVSLEYTTKVGNISYRPVWEFDVKGVIVPPTVAITIAEVTDKSVELAIESEDADEMAVYRNGQKIANLPGDATSYLDTGLEATTDYTYWVEAKNDVGTTRSDTVTVTTKRPETSLDLGGVQVGSVSDLWRTIVSLAANFWQFVLLGIVIGLAEWLFRLPGKGVKALKIKGKETKT
jgi:hypothetical protein